MNRRRFLKMLAAVAAAPAVRPKAAPKRVWMCERVGYAVAPANAPEIKVISVHKYGRAIQATYESLRMQQGQRDLGRMC
jgi:hypothetical protein